MKNWLRLTGAGHTFDMISDNPNVSLGFADCSLYPRRVVLINDYHKKRLDMLAYTPIEQNFSKTVAETVINPRRQNQFLQKEILNNAPVRRIAFATNAISVFTRFYTENHFLYKKLAHRQIKPIGDEQLVVDFEAADNCHLYATTTKAMNLQYDISPFPAFNYREGCVLVFERTSMQVATEKFQLPDLVGGPLTLEFIFASLLENVTQLFVLEERKPSVNVEKFGVLGKNVSNG